MASATGGDTKPLALTNRQRRKMTRGSIREETAVTESVALSIMRCGSYSVDPRRRSYSAAHTSPIILRRSRAGLGRLAEGFDGLRFRVIDVENREQLGDLQDIAHTLGQIRQFDRSACVLRRDAQSYESA